MITADFLSGLDRFSLIVKKRVTSNYAGGRASTALGRGVTIKDHRIYAPGDDFKLIDWKIYARTDDLYVRRYEEERNLMVHIIIDCSASMGFGKPLSKFDYASMIGVGFAYLAMQDNEKFQFSTFSEGLELFQSKRGLKQLAAMIDYLNEVKTGGHSQFMNAITKYKKLLSSRSMIIIISDFLFPVDDIKNGLCLVSRHDLHVIHVLDPAEWDLKLDGDVKLHDSESKQIMRTYISPRIRQRYQERLEAHISTIDATCTQISARFNVVKTDTPIFDAFYELLN